MVPVTRGDAQFVIFYLGDEEDNVRVKETREIDLEELLFHLDAGSSVFLTMKPENESLSTLKEWM